MFKEAYLEKKKAEAQNLLEQFKSAVNQPRLYVYQFFEDMKNDIDIQSCKTLNKETNKERIYEHQAKLIVKVQEFESLCLEKFKIDSDSDFQMIIEQTESILKGPLVSQAELDIVHGLLSNEILKIEKVLFQDKCMFFVKAGEIDDDHHDKSIDDDDDESVSDTSIANDPEILIKIIKKNNFFGLLIMVEDCFIRKEVLNTK
jgi:hypothetical protein